MRARIQRERAVVAQHCNIILANSVVLAAYRNGPVQDLHAGRVPAYDMRPRRPGKSLSFCCSPPSILPPSWADSGHGSSVQIFLCHGLRIWQEFTSFSLYFNVRLGVIPNRAT